MKSFVRAITIIIVLNLLLEGSTTAQTVPGTVSIEQTVNELNEAEAIAASDLDDMLKRVKLHIARTGQYGGGRVLVIPTAEIKPEDLITIMEDMNVMSRIFDKKLTPSYLIQRRSFNSRIRISTPFSRDSRSTGAMYVQGYGMLFLTKVDFPLSPPPEIPEEKKTEESTDPIWDQTKQEIYMPEDVRRSRSRSGRSEEMPSYDAEKVDDLKRTLTRTLKHAANIRGLKPDEWVNVTVISSAALTIRAKKSDIDAFSEGELDFDEFRQKVVIFTYPYLPGVERGRTLSINVRNPIAE